MSTILNFFSLLDLKVLSPWLGVVILSRFAKFSRGIVRCIICGVELLVLDTQLTNDGEGAFGS